MKEALTYRLGWQGLKAPLGLYLCPSAKRFGMLRTRESRGSLSMISWAETDDPDELRTWVANRAGQPLVCYLDDPLLLEKDIAPTGAVLSEVMGVGIDQQQGFWTQVRPMDTGRWASVLSSQSWSAWKEDFATWEPQLVHASISPKVIDPLQPLLTKSSDGNLSEALAAELGYPEAAILAYGAVLEWRQAEVAPITIAQPERAGRIQLISRGIQTVALGIVLLLCVWIGMIGWTTLNQSTISDLQAELATQAPLLEQLRELESQQVLSIGGSALDRSYIAQRIDRIFHEAGPGWRLTQLEIHPDEEILRQIDRSIATEPDMVLIGEVPSMQDLTQIIQQLETITWAKVELWKTGFALRQRSQQFTLFISWP